MNMPTVKIERSEKIERQELEEIKEDQNFNEDDKYVIHSQEDIIKLEPKFLACNIIFNLIFNIELIKSDF
jgi:hypothetical protein